MSVAVSQSAAPWKNAIHIQASHVISLARVPLDTLTFFTLLEDSHVNVHDEVCFAHSCIPLFGWRRLV